MSRQPFSLQKRMTKSGYIYYVQFWSEDEQRYGTAKSTGQSNRIAATRWAVEFIRNGGLVCKKTIVLNTYAEDFFNPHGSYAQYELSRGKKIGNTHLNHQQAYLKNHILPELGMNKMTAINRQVVEKFRLTLIQKNLAAATVNHILLTLGIILRWAERHDDILKAPHIDNVYGEKKVKSILTPAQVKQLFLLPDWPRHHLVINMLGYSTGMRLGEIRALKQKHVITHADQSYVEVVHSWDRTTGLKSTKNGKARIVPLPSRVANELDELITEMKDFDPESFIFPGRTPGQPLDQKSIQKVLYKQLGKIGFDEALRTKLAITFHSSRHFYNSQLVNAHIPMLKIQALTGHQSDQMTETYYHLDDLKDVALIAEGLIG